MKIEKQNLENHEVKLNVELDKEEFAPYMNKAAKKIAGKQRIPGFRPGKAPANVVRNMEHGILCGIDQRAMVRMIGFSVCWRTSEPM